MKILMCTDGSFYSENALAYAARLICAFEGHELVVLYVMPKIKEEFRFYEKKFDEEVRKLKEVELKKAETIDDLNNLQSVDLSFKVLEKAYKLLMKFDLEPHTKARIGNPADEILTEAENGKYDLIIMGKYGFSESKNTGLLFKTTKIGKVASTVITKSDIPVLVL